MHVQVLLDPDALARAAAAEVAQTATMAVTSRGICTLAFSGGSTPASMLAHLAGHDLPWDRIHVLQVDERVAPDGHADRNLTGLRRDLVDRIPLPEANLNAMEVGHGDAERAALDYAAVLTRVAGHPAVLDLVHLGLGSDGHTASLLPDDPAATTDDRDVVVTRVHQGRRRVTLTMPVLERARRLLWLVSGDKAVAVARLLASDPSVPAGRVPQHRALLFCDQAAAPAGGARD
ncbi:6-phosphogluconolactonase [soil metagenome]